MEKTALISVSDRTGLVEFARELQALGYTLLTTHGSGSFLKQNGIESSPIDTYTGQNEILGGRVKTLHPKIYAGILARRNLPEDLKQVEEAGVKLIDIVVVNLYPFVEQDSTGKSLQEMVELIDIGGPSMIRAAAKNSRWVIPLIDPADYGRTITALRSNEGVNATLRQELSAKVFATLAHDAISIGNYLSNDAADQNHPGSSLWSGKIWRRAQALRYGENPQQQAVFLAPFATKKEATKSQPAWQQLGGKELSYNNMLDCDAAIRLAQMLRNSNASARDQVAAIIIKHLNPCGVAWDKKPADALRRAKRCDPRSHFGGVLAFTGEVDQATAEEIREDFCEIVLAPSYHKDALPVLATSKNLRVVSFDFNQLPRSEEVRSVLDGFLVQQSDLRVSDVRTAQVVSKKRPSEEQYHDLQFAWALCSQVKSNAIVVVKDLSLLGVGAGQMSRIDSVEVALFKAKVHDHDTKGAVAASDAFFPFPDGLERLAQAGISAIVVPKGAKRDADTIAAADRLGVALLFVEDRHFRH